MKNHDEEILKEIIEKEMKQIQVFNAEITDTTLPRAIYEYIKLCMESACRRYGSHHLEKVMRRYIEGWNAYHKRNQDS